MPLMSELGRTLQVMGLVIVPAALFVPGELAELSILALGAGLFVLGWRLAKRP